VVVLSSGAALSGRPPPERIPQQDATWKKAEFVLFENSDAGIVLFSDPN
jgi:hypothetical protein